MHKTDDAIRSFSFVVPTRGRGGPVFSERFVPTAWLMANGREVERTLPPPEPILPEEMGSYAPDARSFDDRMRDASPPPEAVRFAFRLLPTMRDEMLIDRAVDEINGGPDVTVDLDKAIDGLWRSMRTRFEAELWPEGRPETRDPEELKREEHMIDMLYKAPENATDRGVLERMHALRDRTRVAAEWGVMIVDPPRGWADISSVSLRSGLIDIIVAAYLRAKSEAEEELGKAQRSAS